MREVTLHADYQALSQSAIGKIHEEVSGGIDNNRSGYASLALPRTTSPDTFTDIDREFDNPETVVTIGMGGSARSSRAITSALALDGHYLLNTPDPRRVKQVIDEVPLEDTVFHVASQSGATRETIAVFNAVRAALDSRSYDITNQAVATTREHSPLGDYAEEHEIPVHMPPIRVTGRFSTFSVIGLLPVALLGGDVGGLLRGAREALDEFEANENSAPFAVAGLLEGAHDDGYPNVALIPYASGFEAVASWFVQLWSESLGDADAEPTEPTYAEGPAVQHARLQQLLSDATKTTPMFVVFDDYGNFHNLGSVMEETYAATRDALGKVGVPSLAFNMARRSPEALGWLLMTLQLVTVVVGTRRDIPVFKNTQVNAIKNRLTIAEFDG